MDRFSALHLSAGESFSGRPLAVFFAAVLTVAATAQSFTATTTGSLLASASISGPTQSYGPGPITVTPVTVTASGAFGIGTVTASSGATSLQASLGASGSGSASASIVVLLQAPVGAGVKITVFGLLSGLGNFGVTMAGQSYSPGPGGSIEAEALVPAGGLPVQISCSVIPPPFSQSNLSLLASWAYPGVVAAGAPTPGCLGPAVAWTRGIPRLGNSSFGFTCVRAHPLLGAVSAVGLGGLSTPFVYDGVNVWLDPSQPINTLYLASNAAGDVFHPLGVPNRPSFLGMVVWTQFLLLEPAGCMPLGLSGSNAIRVTLQA